MIEVLDYNLAAQLQQVDEEGNPKVFEACTFKVLGSPFFDYASLNELTRANNSLAQMKIKNPQNISIYDDILNVNNEVIAQIETFRD